VPIVLFSRRRDFRPDQRAAEGPLSFGGPFRAACYFAKTLISRHRRAVNTMKSISDCLDQALTEDAKKKGVDPKSGIARGNYIRKFA